MSQTRKLEIKVVPDTSQIRRALLSTIGLQEVNGYIWCDQHGCVHDDTTNPYDSDDDRCSQVDHRVLYMRLDDDYDGEVISSENASS